MPTLHEVCEQLAREALAGPLGFWERFDAMKAAGFCTCQMVSMRVEECPLHGAAFRGREVAK